MTDLLRRFAYGVVGLVGLVIVFAAGHYLWPNPPDPRAAPWEAREREYQEQDARQRAEIHDLKKSARESGARVVTLTRYVHDTLRVVVESDTTEFVTVSRAWLASLADSVEAMVKRTEQMRRDYERAISVLTVRLSQADSIIALARPIIHDARTRHGWRTDVLLGSGWALAAILILR